MRKNIINIVIALFFIFVSAYAEAEVISTFCRCLRFDLNHMIDDVTIHSSVNLGNIDWITINKDENMFYFIADNDNENLETKALVCYSGTWPTPEANQDPDTLQYDPQMNGYIYCQWDVTNCTPVKADQTITNRILRSFEGIQMDNDVDIYTFLPTNSVYCIEMPTNSRVKMSVGLNTSDFSNISFEWTTNVYNCLQGSTKRCYKDDWIVGEKYYITLYCSSTNDYYSEDQNYIFTIRNVQPIVLVHGIRSGPVKSTDTTNTAFKIIKDVFPFAEDLRPTVFYDFPWDSKEHSYVLYYGSSRNNINILYGYVYNICSYCAFAPVVISHSIGGRLTISQVEMESRFMDFIKSFVFFGTPFCGADAASYPVIGYLSHTHHDNIYYLKRGTKNVWDLLSEIPSCFFSFHSTYFIGIDPLLEYEFFKEKRKINGGMDCDGVVPVSSANLPETLNKSSEHINVNYNHSTMKELKIPLCNDYVEIYNKLKNHIN